MAKRRDVGEGVSNDYMHTIREYKRIDTKEEAHLSELIHNGTPEERRQAIDALVCANLRLVVKIAHDFKQYDLPLADLVSEGNLGLITAAERFEPGHGAKFSCYAAWWIKQAMRKAIAFQSQMVRVPQGSMQNLFNMWKARRYFIAENMRAPTEDELKQLTGFSDVMMTHLSTINNETVSMFESIDTESESTYEDVLSAQPVDNVLPDMKDRLRTAIEQCTTLEKHLVKGYFGLDAPEPTPVSMLAQELGLSMKAVSDRLAQTLEKLKGLMSAEPDFTLGV